jgi:MFS family permease
MSTSPVRAETANRRAGDRFGEDSALAGQDNEPAARTNARASQASTGARQASTGARQASTGARQAVGAGGNGKLSRAVRASRAWLSTGPVADRNFRLLVGGQTTSTIGDYCYAVALPWMVLSARGGVALLGLVLACYGIPRTALIPVGGILADKISARMVMLAADTARCGLAGAFVYLDATHHVTLAALGPVAALVGACSGLFIPASYSLLPHLLPSGDLQPGNAIASAGNQLGAFVGPAIAGVVVTTLGGPAAFGVDGGTFAVSAITLALIRRRRQPDAAGAAPTAAATAPPAAAAAPPAEAAAPPAEAAAPPAGVTALTTGGPAESAPGASSGATAGADGELRPGRARPSGLAGLLREPVMQSTMAVALIANVLATGTFAVAMPDLAHARYGASGYGAMLACFGAGALVGALLAARRTNLRAPAVTACRAFILAAVAVGVLPYLGGLPGACAAILVLAVSATYGDIILITLIQQWAPPELLGRVMSMIMLASMGSYPISVAVTGFLVNRFGPEPFFPVGGTTLALAVIVAVCRPEIRTLGTQSARRPHAAEALPTG